MTRALRLGALAAALAATSCVNLGDAERELCASRPGLCPDSPPFPEGFELLGYPEPCRTVEAFPGTWTPREPESVQTYWDVCDGDGPQAACTRVSDGTSAFFTIGTEHTGRFIRATLVAQDQGRTFEFTRTMGPVETLQHFAYDTAFFTGFESMALPASNVNADGVLMFVGSVGDAHGGTAVLEVSGASPGVASIPIPEAPSISTFRFAFRYRSQLPASGVIAEVPLATAFDPNHGLAQLSTVGNRLHLELRTPSGSSSKTANVDLVPDAWFEIEVRLDSSDPTAVQARWTVANTEQPENLAPAEFNYMLTALRLGTANVTDAYTVQYDDLILGAPGAGFPIGDLRVEALTVEGTGMPQGASSLAWSVDNAMSLTTLAEGDESWIALDDWPVEMGSAADGVVQYVTDPGAYVEYHFQDLGRGSRALALRPIFALHGVDCAIQSVTGVITDGAIQQDVFTHTPTSPPIDTSVAYRDRLFSYGLDQSSGWSTCSVNPLRARFGYSQNAICQPFLDAVMVEVLIQLLP